ncbi:microrchidia 7-like protein [Tanacetum coccineum]|uniref:Microrchidia 7-like protein n=1 Tax=Tanacetum coccineum TaxID=301880 RepID=A0ABQ5H973_9ASTR
MIPTTKILMTNSISNNGPSCPPGNPSLKSLKTDNLQDRQEQQVFDPEIEQLADEYELGIGKKGHILEMIWENCKNIQGKAKEWWYDYWLEEDEKQENGDKKYDPPMVHLETFEVTRYSFDNGNSFICCGTWKDIIKIVHLRIPKSLKHWSHGRSDLRYNRKALVMGLGIVQLMADNGGGMTPDKMRGCMSLGYSEKRKLANSIGQSDVLVFTRNRGQDFGRPTQSIRMLSYTFLMETGEQDIVVPMMRRMGNDSADYLKKNKWIHWIEAACTPYVRFHQLPRGAGSYLDFSGGMDLLRVHPWFLHSNATSHKWALRAFAKLLNNSLDEVRTEATYVKVDMLNNEKDTRYKMLLIEDNGGGMTPDKMHGCMSLGYYEKSKLANTIGEFLRPTQSIGMLSYTFLMETGKQDIVVPMDTAKYEDPTSLFAHLLIAGIHPNANLGLVKNAFATRKKWEDKSDKTDVMDMKVMQFRSAPSVMVEP